MADNGAVFLSPHHDDVAFSVASFSEGHGGDRLINVFSTSGYSSKALGLPSDAAFISKLRNLEDDRFARAAGLSRINLGESDSPLRGHDPFDAADREREAGHIRDVLMRELAPRAGQTGRPRLFCPSGIGGHRDHLLVRDAIIAAYPTLARNFHVAFYEDLPYASNHARRLAGVESLKRAAAFLDLTRFVRKTDARKLDLISVYASQFAEPPTDLSEFCPADGSGEPHEAVWSAEPLLLQD